ncbi:MAG: hypothetical protein ACEQSK_08285 [Sphingomonadaceae bacterium]
MSAASTSVNLAALLLRSRLALSRAGAPAVLALLSCVAAGAAWAWMLPQRAQQAQWLAQPLPVPRTLASAPPPPSANQNLAAFYEVLGERRYAEQQVKLLFDLAAKSNLTLAQGEYKAAFDKASGVSTYQVLLPVKGSYGAIWQFAMHSLREMPFAALDEISFRRDSIAEPVVEARLRVTLYLKDAEPVVQP